MLPIVTAFKSMIIDRSKSIKSNTHRQINCFAELQTTLEYKYDIHKQKDAKSLPIVANFKINRLSRYRETRPETEDLRLETEARGHDSRARVCK